MNETDMLTHILEIFWIEKLRFTQYTINKIAKIPDSEYEFSSADRPKSIAWAVEQMVAFDRNFAFYLPLSLRFGALFSFPPYKELDVEKDVEDIRDKFTPPAFPLRFLDISIDSAKLLNITNVNVSKEKLIKDWRLTLIRIEDRLAGLSEKEAFKKRYASLSGIHTLPGAINNSTEFCHFLWNKHAAPFLES
ncbi:hypothetical protein [Leptospira ilyithenensis]|uniref:Uncharacterized protein n=1 Tax=Leptospira ilyithenensis TaxID=2484901 RepID=A0A4R9LUC8_9LEPT|nr:hypothetical protein [Leptospira ilyithenensis]TGN14322.1 hypothetical protein EHS11_02270 [Leptospira ilyithenensis]